MAQSGTSRAAILAYLAGARQRESAADIAAELACSPTQIAAQLKHLADAGRVHRTTENRCIVYWISPAAPQ